MHHILTIAKREVKRVRSRFSGGASPLTVLVLLGALALSAFAFRQMSVVGDGMYRVGVSPDGPRISDSRFSALVLDRASGNALLNQHALDVYIDGTRVVARSDTKSRYAVGALKRYLERRELERINATYDIARAFPLRVEVNYITATVASALPSQGASLADLMQSPPTSIPTEPLAPTTASPSSQPSATDAAVLEQLRTMEERGALPEIKFNSTSDKEIIIPSLMTPPAPFAQVIVAFLYILPVSFISIFFTSSFMDEKINRRLTILMSAPVTPFQIIVGKMLPYALFSLAAVAAIALLTGASVPLALAIFAPAALFIFAIYLMVPLLYRTFKDVTFIAMLATTLTTAYLIFPAMFSGISDLAFMSPLTLAVKMYRGESFGLQEYLFPSAPMVLIFLLSMYVGTRMLNEEFLMAYRPLSRKIADAIYLVMDRAHPYASVALLSLLVIPIVYMIQLVILAISTNLPIRYMLVAALIASAIVEEVAKSAGIAVLLEHRIVRSARQVLFPSFLSALGFLIGEKALLLISVSVVSESSLSGVLFNSGFLLAPLAAHFVFTSIVCLLTQRTRYSFAILAGTFVHAAYNVMLIGGL